MLITKKLWILIRANPRARRHNILLLTLILQNDAFHSLFASHIIGKKKTIPLIDDFIYVYGNLSNYTRR